MKSSFFRNTAIAGILALSSLTATTSSYAQSVFTVQLGSFESEAEARNHWEKIQSRFPDIFEPLNYKPSEIQLPPDDFVYHRTQAGPISTKAEAEDICERLLIKGFECYVAETAMFSVDGEQIAEEQPAPPPPPAAEPPMAMAEPATQDVDMMETDELASLFAPSAPEPVEQAMEAAPQMPMEAPVAPPAPEIEPLPEMAAAEALPPMAPPPAPAREMKAPDLPWNAAPAADRPSLTTPPTPVSAPFQSNQSAYIDRNTGREMNKPQSEVTLPRMPQETVTAPPMTAVDGPTERAQVKVAEAIPVPIGSSQQAAPVYATQRPTTFRGYPSQPLGKASLWAEISYFKSQRAALSYWKTLMSRDQLIPNGLRLRITQPLRKFAPKDRLSLRVGPFSSTRAIRRLCSLTQPEQLGCRAVKDLGASVSNNRSRQRIQPGTPPAPRGRAPISSPTTTDGMSWIQLGAFPSAQAAGERWAELKGMHRNVLGNLRESISAPSHSSTTGSRSYRLRVGPFARSMEAISSCEQLKRTGTFCVVVSGR